MRTQSSGAKRAVLSSRLPKESRLAQANRLDLSEATLRWIEAHNRWPRNPIIRKHYLDQLGAAEAE